MVTAMVTAIVMVIVMVMCCWARTNISSRVLQGLLYIHDSC
jgi:hypothetical protein